MIITILRVDSNYMSILCNSRCMVLLSDSCMLLLMMNIDSVYEKVYISLICVFRFMSHNHKIDILF